jgi:hypothetical protein
MKLKDIKVGISFQGELGTMKFIGRIKDIYKNEFVILELIELAPKESFNSAVLWPIPALTQIGIINKISKNKYNCLWTLIVKDHEQTPQE